MLLLVTAVQLGSRFRRQSGREYQRRESFIHATVCAITVVASSTANTDEIIMHTLFLQHACILGLFLLWLLLLQLLWLLLLLLLLVIMIVLLIISRTINTSTR
jgi:hypothetical protein